MTLQLHRRALAAGLLTIIPVGNFAAAEPAGDRLPEHNEFFARLPLPHTPSQAWHRLSPATQAEIGAAVIGMYLAQYIHGDGLAEADQFLDDDLRCRAADVEHDILNRMDDRLWTLFPELYGPDGDHPAWALAGGFAR